METPKELNKFIKNGLKLLRRTKDPSFIIKMLKHMEEVVQEQCDKKQQPTNAVKRISVRTDLFPKKLDIEQTKMIVDDKLGSSRSSSNLLPNTSKSIIEVCSSPLTTTTLEQARSDMVINSDLDSEMEIEDIDAYFCCVCKLSFTNIGNSLVECLDCHSRYHQNCQTPPIIDIILYDPQIVYYCNNCRLRDSQKVECSPEKKSKERSSISTSGMKPEKSTISKTSHISPRKSKSSSVNSNHNNKHYLPTPVMSIVEKRIEMMKKKAAKKSEKKNKKNKHFCI